eukprot:Pgem_evm1s2227
MYSKKSKIGSDPMNNAKHKAGDIDDEAKKKYIEQFDQKKKKKKTESIFFSYVKNRKQLTWKTRDNVT